MKKIHYWDTAAKQAFCRRKNITVDDSEIPKQGLNDPAKYCKWCLEALEIRRKALISKIETQIPIKIEETSETLLSKIKEFNLIKAADFDIITVEVLPKGTSQQVMDQISKQLRKELNKIGLNRNLLWVYSKEYMNITFGRFTGIRRDIRMPKKDRVARRKTERRLAKARRKEFGK